MTDPVLIHPFRPIVEGSVWRVRKNGELWRVVKTDYDGAATYRMVLLAAADEPTGTFDTVWGAELRGDAEEVTNG